MNIIYSKFGTPVGALVETTPFEFCSPRMTQEIVRDEVAFNPARNPYAELNKATQRLREGKSIFTKYDDCDMIVERLIEI